MDGTVVAADEVAPTRTVLQYLREDLLRCGTKEGCAEGDCGACTVVVAQLSEDARSLTYRAVNSCIQFLPALDGKALITVESLTAGELEPHPVQQALVECHGSQCGFCTPGFVMSLYALFQSSSNLSRRQIDTALSGNLCRCTGYRPIVAAARRMFEYPIDRVAFDLTEQRTVSLLQSLADEQSLHVDTNGGEYYAPRKLAELASLVASHPRAVILAGGTDVGLWITKQFRSLPQLISIGGVRELADIEVTASHIDIGAGVTLSDAMLSITEYFPAFGEVFLRFASPPIRNVATLAGNIANGSPIGDAMPPLIAAGATLIVRHDKRTREVALEDFYLDYRKTALRAGEFVERVLIPLPTPEVMLAAYKVSKRFDQDISAVCGAFCFHIEASSGRLDEVRVAYGGLSAMPQRAGHCETALMSQSLDDATLTAAMAALDADFAPISDMRASRDYRLMVAKNLLRRFFAEITGQGLGSVYAYQR